MSEALVKCSKYIVPVTGFYFIMVYYRVYYPDQPLPLLGAEDPIVMCAICLSVSQMKREPGMAA